MYCGITSSKERIEDRASAVNVSTTDAQDVRIEHREQAGGLRLHCFQHGDKVREKQTTRRSINKGCLSMILDQYLRLLDWRSRQIRKDKVGAIPDGCAPNLERLE
jgi:hypothetical protein